MKFSVILIVLTFILLIVDFSLAQRAMRIVGKRPRDLPEAVYRTGWALLIGINKYPNLPSQYQLDYAVADAEALASLLKSDFGFTEITILTDEYIRRDENIDRDKNATKDAIMTELNSLPDPNRVGENDCVLIFFSGHGQTVPLPKSRGGGEMGFLIPHDADVGSLSEEPNLAQYSQYCIAMDELYRAAKKIPAKHIIFIVDACYSGLVLESSKGLDPKLPGYLRIAATTPVQQMITAGGKKEESKERSDLGHGVFTYKLLEGLEKRAADWDNNNVITGSELGIYLRTVVPKIADQTPQFRMEGEGEFLFLPQEQDETTLQYEDVLAAIEGQEYEKAYGVLSIIKDGSEALRHKVSFLRTVIAAAYCAGNLEANESFKRPEVEKDFLAESIDIVTRATEWGRKLSLDSERIVDFAGKKELYISLKLPQPLSDLSFKGIEIKKAIENGQIPSPDEEKILETFMVGVELRHILVRSVNPSASHEVTIKASDCKGNVKWVPDPLITICEALNGIGRRNVRALKHIRRMFGITEEELKRMLGVSKKAINTAKEIDEEGKYRSRINKLSNEVDELLDEVREVYSSPPDDVEQLVEVARRRLREAGKLSNEEDYEACIDALDLAIPELERASKAWYDNPDLHLELAGAYYMKMDAAAKLPPGKKLLDVMMEVLQKDYPTRAREEVDLFLNLADPDHPKRESAKALQKFLKDLEGKLRSKG